MFIVCQNGDPTSRNFRFLLAQFEKFSTFNWRHRVYRGQCCFFFPSWSATLRRQKICSRLNNQRFESMLSGFLMENSFCHSGVSLYFALLYWGLHVPKIRTAHANQFFFKQGGDPIVKFTRRSRNQRRISKISQEICGIKFIGLLISEI